jgi:hypothetical protein
MVPLIMYRLVSSSAVEREKARNNYDHYKDTMLTTCESTTIVWFIFLVKYIFVSPHSAKLSQTIYKDDN